MKTVIVEGWRFLAHSYAVVNQFQCLEILKRPDITLYHRDVPFYNTRWLPTPGILPAEYEAALNAIPAPPPGIKADAMLRIGFPHYFDESPEASRTFIWVTSEFKLVTDSAIGNGGKPWQVLPTVKSTVIACSNWAAAGFIKSGLPKSRLVVIPCGVDTDLFKPATPEERAETRRALGWEGHFVALNISSLTQNKGFDLMLKAVARLATKHPSLILSCKGSDDLYNSATYAQAHLTLLNKDEKAALPNRVKYMGVTLSTMDIAKMYQAADVYISPYRAEGFNLPILEAAACGLPVICTRGGSTEDFVDDSWCLRVDGKEESRPKLGNQIEPNIDQLTSLLDRTITDEAWRKSASSAAVSWVREKFTWKHSMDRMLKLMLG